MARQEQAYRDEIRAEEDLHQERKEEKALSEDMHNPGIEDLVSEPSSELETEWEPRKMVHEGIDKDAADRNLTDVDVFVIWNLGLAAWEASRKFGAKFPHE